jgi:hypothetical protein
MTGSRSPVSSCKDQGTADEAALSQYLSALCTEKEEAEAEAGGERLVVVDEAQSWTAAICRLWSDKERGLWRGGSWRRFVEQVK